jgi:imidazolonepropionase-like amidohydrolase
VRNAVERRRPRRLAGRRPGARVRRRDAAWPAAGTAAFLLLLACAASPEPVDLVVIAPKVLDVQGDAIRNDVAILIDDGKITSIVEASYAHRLAAKERLVLPDDVMLLPGLIDAHTHLAWRGAQNEDAARATLLAGFTTVRVPGATGDADLALRRAIEEGRALGPRMLVARGGIGAKGGVCEQTFGTPGVSTPDEARTRVRELIEQGADFIKICTGGGVIGRAADAAATEMPQDVIDAIVSEAHARNKRVAAHAQGPAAIRAAANAGVDSIEHGGLIDGDAARLLAQKRIPLVPTLARLGRNPKLHEETMARVRRARELGVPIVFGTDGSVLPHGENARELESLTAAGMTPIDAIRAATIDAARLLGWESRVGDIAPGYEADLIAVTSLVPLEVRFVIARGKIVRTAADTRSAAARPAPRE